jgi:CheY-like chemotaxis protein
MDGRPSLRILLVEDHEATSALLIRLLRSNGHVVTAAGTVAEAMAFLRESRYDLLLSDLGLPDGSGLDILPALDGRRPPRAIALSGYGTEQDVAATRAAGFDAHLTKPVDLRRLEQTIAAVTASD